MLETVALIVGLAVIAAIVVGAGLFSLLILGGIFFVILVLTKTILFAVIMLLILASPFFAIAILAKVCKDRTVPGTNWPLGKSIAVAATVLIVLAVYGLGRSMNGMTGFLGDMKTMMEQCDGGGDHSTDMDLSGRHYHFSCKSAKPQAEGQDM